MAGFFYGENMKKLWQKNWTLNQSVEFFETKSDVEFDHYLLKWDVLASYVHALGVQKIGFLKKEDISQLKKGFQQILELGNKNKFNLELGDEDIHTKIENFLTSACGESGKKIHTGRSRNDQVLTALRLFTKEQLLEIWSEVLELIKVFNHFAQKYEYAPLVGYTHMQPAMPSSFGLWAGAFSEGFLDNLQILQTAYDLNDQSPLGSAVGYGVPLPLDRSFTAEQLGFAKVQINPLYCQNSRAKIEANVLAALNSILFDINRFASDVMLFTTAEFNFLKVSVELYSGSSIMPQKQNLDLAELLRSKVHVNLGNYVQILSLSTNLISGYNRDIQDSKKPLIESLLLTKDCLKMMQLLVKNLSPVDINSKLPSEVFTTHYALSLLKQGLPFREAYHQAAIVSREKKIPTPKNYLDQSKHIGGTGNLQLKELIQKLSNEEKLFKHKKQTWTVKINQLENQIYS